MPGAATHTTVIQRLAKLAQTNSNPDFAKFLTDPDANGDWGTYSSQDALQSRYAVLGAMGPDIFYMMLDYGASEQNLEDTALKIAGTFRCVGQLSSEINNLINTGLNMLTHGVWDDIQAVFTNLKGILVDDILEAFIDTRNFWYFFLPLRQVDDYQTNWYWADFLHYVKTGCFTQKVLDNAAAQQAADPDSNTSKCLGAYALGYLTHYVADTAGHAYVNRIVESPWRNMWQRHHLVENFIDADVWANWHDAGTPPDLPADEQNLDTLAAQPGDPLRPGAASLNYARLNDLCNIGSAGLDPIIDKAITSICESIQQGLFDIGLSSVPSIQPPDDPVFTTWTEFMADTMWQVYSTGQSHPTRMGRYPTSDDVAGAYGAYRVILSLATEDEVDPPVPPDIGGDLSSILQQLWQDISADLSSIPPPPTPSGNISLAGLWDALVATLEWLGQVADAALAVLADLIASLIETGIALAADTIAAGLYLLNTILYSMYMALRMPLVMSAYSSPLRGDLTATWGPLDLRTLWNAGSTDAKLRYPIEPEVSQRDYAANPANPFSPYRPYFTPSGMAPVNVESPATVFPRQVLGWATPADMLDSPAAGTHDMFSVAGPAPATTAPLLNPDGTKLTDLETLDGSERYFGAVMANCQAALDFAVPYLTGTPYPAGVVLPDYNLDSDRGYAWPCWDVDWSYKNPMAPFPWNGCDPYPSDTLARLAASPPGIDWGAMPPDPAQIPPGLRAGLTVNDPWGSPRSGDAWVNATTLGTPGSCQYASFPFPSIVVDPNRPDLAELDQCTDQQGDTDGPGGGLLGPDYRFAPNAFLHSDPDDPHAPTNDVVDIYLRFPYSGATTAENDRRLADFFRALVSTARPQLILANAVSLALGGATTPLPWGSGTITGPAPILIDASLAVAVAQLAVTGRTCFTNFQTWTPQNADLVTEFNNTFPNASFTPAQVEDAASTVLDAAYTALWAIRSNDPGWRNFRASLGWIAVSGFDDRPHRPVNIPTAPYPQYDIGFSVPIANPDPLLGGLLDVTSRYMIASAGTFAGPDDPATTSFTDPDPALLQAPPTAFSPTPAPRTIPQDTPVIPADNKIIIYIHGGGSRTEEAVDMANWFIVEGTAVGQQYTVISFDMPNSAYGSTFEVTDVTGTPYDFSQLNVLQFEQQYVIGFIEALDALLGNVKERIVAVMGGSLGGNMSLLMTDWFDQDHPYLQTIVSWSVTAAAPDTYLGIISAGDVAAYLSGLQAQVTSAEPPDNHTVQAQYIQSMYKDPLSSLLGIPAQPVMWYRGGYADRTGQWQPCKDESIARSRFDRYEIYSPSTRHWTTAIDLEQVSFSFQDNSPHLRAVSTSTSNLMLVSGDNDNFFPNAIFNSTIDLTRAIRLSARGKAEFWLDTGHSIHNERPHLFAREIIYFLTHLDAGDSPNGVVVSTPPNAVYSVTDQ